MRRFSLTFLTLVVVLVSTAAAAAVADVSHVGWPQIDGRLWQSKHNGQHSTAGTARNDELLGAHGNDVIHGGDGNDVIWGDELPSGQPTSQRDALFGEGGDDWIYTSHGTNTVSAGAGNDFVWAYYGHGTIDCGPGFDTVRVRTNGAYRLRGCERVRHFCAWGETAKGVCHKPGEKGAKRQGALG